MSGPHEGIIETMSVLLLSEPNRRPWMTLQEIANRVENGHEYYQTHHLHTRIRDMKKVGWVESRQVQPIKRGEPVYQHRATVLGRREWNALMSRLLRPSNWRALKPLLKAAR